jgi:hypothetical protein
MDIGVAMDIMAATVGLVAMSDMEVVDTAAVMRAVIAGQPTAVAEDSYPADIRPTVAATTSA